MANPIPGNPDNTPVSYPEIEQDNVNDQRQGLEQRAAVARNLDQASSTLAPPWVRFTQNLRAKGVKGPMHKDLFARSRLSEEARVSLTFFKAYSDRPAGESMPGLFFRSRL